MRLFITLTMIAASIQAADFKLPPGCKLPPALNSTDPFVRCGNDGSGLNFSPIQDAAKVREDEAKNTFCADMSHPVMSRSRCCAICRQSRPRRRI
jgi:hypothetical protein